MDATESPDAAHAAGARCSVCASPVETPARVNPSYRKLLACNRAGVCPAHLTPGVHVVAGIRVRYCTNHHVLHPETEFESRNVKSERTNQTTCARARDLSVSRFKRQRNASATAAASRAAAGGGTSGGSTQLGHCQVSVDGAAPLAPLCGDPLLQVPPLLVGGWEEDVEDALLGWPWDDKDGSGGNRDDPFSLFPPPMLTLKTNSTPLVLPTPPSPVPLHVQPRDAITTTATSIPQPSAVHHTAAANVSAVGPVVAAFMTIQSLATSPQTAASMRCVAGDRAKAYAEECPAAAAQYACAWRLSSPLRRRQARNLDILLGRLQGLVPQARQDVLARGRANSTTGEELVRVLDAMHDLASRRRLALAAVADSRLLSYSIAFLIQELRDGNEVHMCNAAALLELVRSSAESGNAEVYAEVVRLVAEFVLLQLGLVMSALSERNSWMDGLRGGGRHQHPEKRRLAALAGNCMVDIRRGWECLLQHWQARVIAREDAFFRAGHEAQRVH